MRQSSRPIPKGHPVGYAQGDTVVHPQHGAAVVGALLTKDLGQGPTEYLELYVDSASMKILVPAASVERVGIRSLSSRKEAEDILALLEDDAEVPTEWSERNTATTARMKSCELDQIAMVVRDLLRHQRRIGKPLNTGEKTALDSCLGILARELSLSLEMTEEATLELLLERGSGGEAAQQSDSATADG